MIHEHDADRPYALLDRAAADTLRNIRRDIARVPEPVTRVLKRIHRHLFRADFDAADARRTEPDGSVLPAVEMQFRAQLGVPIAIYLREQRLAIALRLMYTSSLPLDQIAVLVGYSSRRAFSQAFRQAHDCTPSAHRRRALPEMVFSAPEDDLLLDLRTWRRILTGQAHAQDVGRLIDRLHRLYPTLRDVELDEPLGLGTADEQAKVAWPLLHQLDNDARRRLVTRGLRLENTALVDSLLRQSWRRAWHDLDDAAETARLALLTTRALQPTLPRDVRIEACARGHLHLAHAHRSMGGHDRAALHLAVADRLIDGLAHAERSAAPLLQAAVHAALALDRQRYRAAIERLDPIIAFLQLETPPVAAPPSPRRPSSFELPPQSAPHPVWDPALRPLAIAWRFDQRVSRTDLDADAVEARNGVCDLGLAAYLLQLRGRAAYHLGHARQAVIWLERARGYSGRAVDAPRLDLAIGCDLARACIARGQLVVAARLLDALRERDAHAGRRLASTLRALRGRLDLRRGHLRAAREHLRRSRGQMLREGHRLRAAVVALDLARLHQRDGRAPAPPALVATLLGALRDAVQRPRLTAIVRDRHLERLFRDLLAAAHDDALDERLLLRAQRRVERLIELVDRHSGDREARTAAGDSVFEEYDGEYDALDDAEDDRLLRAVRVELGWAARRCRGIVPDDGLPAGLPPAGPDDTDAFARLDDGLDAPEEDAPMDDADAAMPIDDGGPKDVRFWRDKLADFHGPSSGITFAHSIMKMMRQRPDGTSLDDDDDLAVAWAEEDARAEIERARLEAEYEANRDLFDADLSAIDDDTLEDDRWLQESDDLDEFDDPDGPLTSRTGARGSANDP